MRYWLKLIVVNVAVMVTLFLVAMAGLEVYLRATLPAPPSDSIFEYTLASKRYRLMKPDLQTNVWGREFQTNRLGFRDDDAGVPPKRPAEFRIVVLGDSVTAAAGVAFDDIYTSRLEALLKRDAPDIEVINLGVGGYNIIQYAALLDEVALTLDPDLVIVGVLPRNDLLSTNYRTSKLEAQGYPERVTTRWFQNLYVYQGFLGKIAFIRQNVEPRNASPLTPVQRAQDREDNLSALTTIVEQSRSRDMDLLVVLLPYTDSFDLQRQAFRPFEAECAKHDWPCLSLLPGFEASGLDPESLRLNLLDSHPDEQYHALMAQLIAPAVISLRQRPLQR